MKNRFKNKKYALGVQSVGTRPLPPKRNPGKAAAGALTGAAAGAAAGSVGGPIGIAAGAVIGGATSLIKTGAENKANDAAFEEELKQFKEDSIDALQDKVRNSTTQANQLNQAAKGLFHTDGIEEIEVEKDELIFRKTPIGKYILKADFKGGKTHNKGGEDYVASEGDIIFPGKDRKKVMQAFNSGDDLKMESMRMKLPRDLKQNQAQDGLDNTDPIKRRKALSLKASLEGLTIEEQEELNSLITNAKVNIPDDLNAALDSIKMNIDSSIGINPKDKTFIANKRNFINTKISASPIISPTSVENKTSAKEKNRKKTVDPRIASKKRTDIPTQRETNIPEIGKYMQPSLQNNIIKDTTTAITAVPEVNTGGGIPYGAIAQLGAAATNLFPGAAEVQSTPNVNLQKEQYKDTSEPLRQQSKITERIARANARNLSGGNVQNLLANQRIAGIQNIRNLENINNQEFARSQGIANRNVGIENRERLINSQLSLRDDIANQQNRAARRNQIQQGVSQLGTIGGQMGQDAAARTTEEKMLKTLNSLGSFQVNADGSISLKKNN